MKGKGAGNSAFFKNAGGNDLGGGADIVVAASKRSQNIDYAAQAAQNEAFARGGANQSATTAGHASAKAIEAMLKRAQQSGTCNMQGKGLTVFPMDLCNLHELKLIENFWEAYELSKVDLSNNEIPSVPEEIAN
jgi:hypothetical protein